MPPFSAAPRRAKTSLSLGFRDMFSAPGTSTFEINPVATDAEVALVATSLGNMSNARLLQSEVKDSSVQINPNNPLNVAFDDGHASVDKVGILVFQNNTTGDLRYVEVPAIDAAFFIQGGKIFVEPDDGAAANSAPLLLDTAITNLLTVFGAGWGYTRGYLRGSGVRQSVVLGVSEPVGNPPDAPGV